MEHGHYDSAIARLGFLPMHDTFAGDRDNKLKKEKEQQRA